MLKRTSALLFVLFVVSATAKAQSKNYGPASYHDIEASTYDPTVGTNGTVYVTVSITGSFNAGTCTYHHTPSADVKLPNGQMAGKITGTTVTNCQNMTFSHVFAFDLFNAGCTGDELLNGLCVFTSELQIDCTAMGTAFWVQWKDIQFERAVTFLAISSLIKSDGMRPVGTFCSANSSPPDWRGITEAEPTIESGEYESAAFLFREVNFGGSFTGVPWQTVFDFGPATGPLIPADFAPPNCTNRDRGTVGIWR